MVIPRRSWEDLAPDKRQIVEWRLCQITTVRALGRPRRAARARRDRLPPVEEMVEAGCSEELLERILT